MVGDLQRNATRQYEWYSVEQGVGAMDEAKRIWRDCFLQANQVGGGHRFLMALRPEWFN